MFVSLNGYKVIYADKVLNALELLEMRKNAPEKHGERGDLLSKPDSIAVLAINSDGNLIIVDDEAWRFQFIPRVN